MEGYGAEEEFRRNGEEKRGMDGAGGLGGIGGRAETTQQGRGRRK